MAMFSRDSDKPTKTSSSSSVIGTEMQINGNIKCQGSLILKGTVKGNIECDEISVSSEGVLKGSVKAQDSIISGKLLLFEKLLNIAISNGVKELSIINALSRHFFKLLYAQSYYKKLGSFDDALKQIKPPIFYKMQKEFIFQTKIWPQKKIEFFITKLLSLEFKLKNNANQPHEYFKSLIFSITKTSYFLKAT